MDAKKLENMDFLFRFPESRINVSMIYTQTLVLPLTPDKPIVEDPETPCTLDVESK